MSCCSACGQHACACGCGAQRRHAAAAVQPARAGQPRLSRRYGMPTSAPPCRRDLSDAALPALAGLRTREDDDPAMALLDAWAVAADVIELLPGAHRQRRLTCAPRPNVVRCSSWRGWSTTACAPAWRPASISPTRVEKDSPPVTIAAGARAQSVPAPGEQMQTFETAEPLDARFEWNALQPRLTRAAADHLAASLDTLDELWLPGRREPAESQRLAAVRVRRRQRTGAAPDHAGPRPIRVRQPHAR